MFSIKLQLTQNTEANLIYKYHIKNKAREKVMPTEREPEENFHVSDCYMLSIQKCKESGFGIVIVSDETYCECRGSFVGEGEG